MIGRRLGLPVVALGFLLPVLAGCTPPPASSAGGTGATSTSVETTSQRLLTEAQNFAFRVRNVNCEATGSSFASRDGIITNRHVASGDHTLELSTWAGTDFNASLQSVSESPGPDLAILNGAPQGSLATFASSDVPAGTPVWVAGYPEGDALSIAGGIVLDYISGSVYGAPGQIMELTNTVEPGNSGSPLLDSQGQVVGVVFALNPITGNGLAIPVSTLAQYLDSPGSTTTGGCIG
jgi:S1-C subfamily serine protease